MAVSDGTGLAVGAGQVIHLVMTNFQNPTTANHTFYARIYTYTTNTGATLYTIANPDVNTVHTDDGGIALSTAALISVQAKVQESLSFCVYVGSCGTAATIYLGDANHVLSAANDYTDKTGRFDISSNATGNVAVVMKGATLTSGSNTIAGIGSTPATINGGAHGTEKFGMCLFQSSGAGFAPDVMYNGSAGAACTNAGQGAGGGGAVTFALDPLITSTGSTIGVLSPTAASTATLVFGADIAVITKAGVYQSTLYLIATGTY
jgi:hypothetical protein